MAAFRAVNSGLAPKDHPVEHPGEARTPTTPRPTSVEHPADLAGHREDESTPNTPTRHSFGGLTGQRPLPTAPFSSSVTPQQSGTARPRPGALTREDSHRSVRSTGSQDVEMDDSEGGEDGSGDESGGESGRPSKKKKGQRFFCTEFPPCTLSFTRSEHLARHIRYDFLMSATQPSVCSFSPLTGNIRGSDPFSVIVPAGSHAWTIYGNMRKRCMSTKTYREIPSRPAARGSSGRYGPNESGRQATDRGPPRLEARVVTAAVTAETCQPRASDRRFPMPANGTNHGDDHPH